MTDEEIQEEVENRMYDYATYDPVTDRGIKEGDYAVVNYTATMDGQKAEDYSGEDEDILVGEGNVFPELDKALIGMKTGEKKTVEVKLDEEFAAEDDIGKTISVEATVGEITIENLPEYNEAFVKENTEYDSAKEYEAAIAEELKSNKEEEYKYAAIDEIMGYLVENSEFNGYPKELYTKCEESYDSNNEYNASMFGMELEEYLEFSGIDEDVKKADIEASVNYELIIGSIAQKEKLECTDEEISEFVKGIYEDYEYESEEDFLEDYSKDEIGYEIVYEKVMDFLYDNANLAEISEEEYAEEHAELEEEGEEIDLEEE